VLDPAPAIDLPLDAFAGVDILTPNQGEAERWTGVAVTDPDSAALAGRRLVDSGVGTALVTLGSAGVVAVDAEGSQHYPAFEVDAVSTLAAGGAFNGVLAAGLAEGRTLPQSIERAQAAAALSTTRTGAQESMPSRSQVEEFLAEVWPAGAYTCLMCGRFTLGIENQEILAKLLGVEADAFLQQHYRPRYNIAPTDDHWLLRVKAEQRELPPAKWGLVNSWAKDAKRAARQINARAESIDTRSAFREAFKTRRCVVPADGYYEWTGAKDSRQPHWFHRPDRGLMLLAGLYESWWPDPGSELSTSDRNKNRPDSEKRPQRTFTIITTDSNALSQPIHDRMPVILPDEDAVDAWMFGEIDPDRLKDLLRPAPDGYLAVSRVSQLANSVKNDGPELLVEQAQLSVEQPKLL